MTTLETEENLLNLINSIYESPTAYIIVNDERLTDFPLYQDKDVCSYHFYSTLYCRSDQSN